MKNRNDINVLTLLEEFETCFAQIKLEAKNNPQHKPEKSTISKFEALIPRLDKLLDSLYRAEHNNPHSDELSLRSKRKLYQIHVRYYTTLKQYYRGINHHEEANQAQEKIDLYNGMLTNTKELPGAKELKESKGSPTFDHSSKHSETIAHPPATASGTPARPNQASNQALEQVDHCLETITNRLSEFKRANRESRFIALLSSDYAALSDAYVKYLNALGESPNADQNRQLLSIARGCKDICDDLSDIPGLSNPWQDDKRLFEKEIEDLEKKLSGHRNSTANYRGRLADNRVGTSSVSPAEQKKPSADDDDDTKTKFLY